MMNSRRIHLEGLLGRVVLDSAGKKAGRLEEVIAGRDGAIEEYVLGREGLWERLGIAGISLIFVGRNPQKSRRVPWEKMDLREMRLRCRVEELEGKGAEEETGLLSP
jgi:sporulation protein YlmC with PRC-barrel domain